MELDMYRYTKEAMDEKDAADAATAGQPSPQQSTTAAAEAAAEAAEAAASTAAAAAAASIPVAEKPAAVAPPNTPDNCKYELRGIVVHSGTANAGHYYSYIKVCPSAYHAETKQASPWLACASDAP